MNSMTSEQKIAYVAGDVAQGIAIKEVSKLGMLN
jgi:hypothetical protein